MTPPLRALLLSLCVLVLGACVSQAELNQALNDDLRYTGRVMGFALDAQEEALSLRLALLKAFEGDPRLALLEAELGSLVEAQAKLERVQAEKRSLVEESQRLRARYPAGP